MASTQASDRARGRRLRLGPAERYGRAGRRGRPAHPPCSAARRHRLERRGDPARPQLERQGRLVRGGAPGPRARRPPPAGPPGRRRRAGRYRRSTTSIAGPSGGSGTALAGGAEGRGVHDETVHPSSAARSNGTHLDLELRGRPRGPARGSPARGRGPPRRAARARPREGEGARPGGPARPETGARVRPAGSHPASPSEEPVEPGGVGVVPRPGGPRARSRCSPRQAPASSDSSSTSSAASVLCGIVTFAPAEPERHQPARAPRDRPGGTGSGT
ncbi:MAG: hypothetical protein KatS3mg013_0332 [Actinomycetota bacterium]|nr:MAG: hypothetical protein KatS3mg013_0332 [Actinomycetota bacterium]